MTLNRVHWIGMLSVHATLERTQTGKNELRQQLVKTLILEGTLMNRAQLHPGPISQKYGINLHFANVIFIVELIG